MRDALDSEVVAREGLQVKPNAGRRHMSLCPGSSPLPLPLPPWLGPGVMRNRPGAQGVDSGPRRGRSAKAAEGAENHVDKWAAQSSEPTVQAQGILPYESYPSASVLLANITGF